jgi:hypothetical protein
MVCRETRKPGQRGEHREGATRVSTGKSPLPKLRSLEKQNSFQTDAARFFDWYRWNYRPCVEKLDAADKKEFESGKMPKKLLAAVRAAWSSELKTHLPMDEQAAVIRKVLPNPRDYDMLMNCPMGKLQTVPKRIHTVIAKALKKRAGQIHSAFFANNGEARLADYLRVWQSQERALTKLIAQANGYKLGGRGDASLGSIPLDAERMFLSEVEATGSAMVRGLLPFIRRLWETDKTVIVKTAAGLENRVIPNPDLSEARLNRFLIKLGRALADNKKRRELPDWLHGVDQTLRYIVHGWCESITVDGERWPPLCFFTTLALAEFLTLCNPPRWNKTQDPRTLERAIRRLGLVSLSRGRIRHVKE